MAVAEDRPHNFFKLAMQCAGRPAVLVQPNKTKLEYISFNLHLSIMNSCSLFFLLLFLLQFYLFRFSVLFSFAFTAAFHLLI